MVQLARFQKVLLSALSALCLLSCGDDAKPEPSQCEQLQNSLCDRTTECALEAGLAHDESRAAFNQRCHTSLTRDQTCSVPADGSGDFELCNADIQDTPCDIVVSFLDADQVVAPTTNCGAFFGL